MINRIKQFIEYLKVNVRDFKIRINASDGTIRRAIKNNTDIQAKWLVFIMENFPLLSAEWLLRGEGTMLKNEPANTTISGENAQTDSNNSIILSLIQQNGDLREEVGRLKAELERLKAGTGNALNVATA